MAGRRSAGFPFQFLSPRPASAPARVFGDEVVFYPAPGIGAHQFDGEDHIRIVGLELHEKFAQVSRASSTDCADHWRCRFLCARPAAELPAAPLNQLPSAIQDSGLRWMHLQKLQEFDGKPGYTKAQGKD